MAELRQLLLFTADRLRNVRLENDFALSHQAEQRHGQHGDGNRSGDREAHSETEVCVRRAEHDAEDDPGDDCADGEFADRVGSPGCDAHRAGVYPAIVVIPSLRAASKS